MPSTSARWKHWTLEEAPREGDPEAQLVAPVRGLLESLEKDVRVVHEMRTGLRKPDLGMKHRGLLVGFVELKAPGKGADPERFRDPHDRRQWENFKNLLARTLDTGEEPLSLERALEMAGLDHPRPTGALRWREVRRYLQQGLSPQEVARRTGVASVLSLKD